MKNILTILLSLFFGFLYSQIKLVDQYSQESIIYNQVNNWEYETTINDSKVDGVIYIKKDNKYYKRNYNTILNASWFGAIPNDNLDDSNALQKAINYAIATSQTLIIPFGKYYIDKTLILPQHFHYSMRNMNIDFSNSKLAVRKDISIFQSDNWGSKIDSKITNGLVVENFEILNEVGNINSYAIKIQDYHQGTKFQNISSSNIKNLLSSNNSYYLELYNINTSSEKREGIRFNFDGYHGLNRFSKLVAGNSDVCYNFQKGMVAALDLRNISVEGCNVGINFSSEVYSLNISSSYFENFNIALVFDNYIHSAVIENNYFNFLSDKNAFLLKYKGLPANNIKFNFGNSYLYTDYNNFFKNREDVYGAGIIFEIPQLGSDMINSLNKNKGKNNIIEQKVK
jgi:hypothetical protein